MTLKPFKFVIIITLIFNWSCNFDNKEEKATENEKTQTTVFKPVEIKKYYGFCENPDSSCYKIEILYLKAENGSKIVKESINKAIDTYIGNELNGFLSDEVTSSSSTELLIQKLFDNYKELANDMKDFHQSWEIKINTEVLFSNDHIISIQGSNENYLGGAHGNHWKKILNFDAKTGKTLTQKDIITNYPEFLKVAEIWFRKTREIPAGADLEKEGYLFTDNQFKLPENIGFTEKGLILIYNPYEAGPYSMGEIKYTIPLSEVKDFIRE